MRSARTSACLLSVQLQPTIVPIAPGRNIPQRAHRTQRYHPEAPLVSAAESAALKEGPPPCMLLTFHPTPVPSSSPCSVLPCTENSNLLPEAFRIRIRPSTPSLIHPLAFVFPTPTPVVVTVTAPAPRSATASPSFKELLQSCHLRSHPCQLTSPQHDSISRR
ncbi:hypothetical protein PMIN03_006189 [Paraphaeosphaeria minitans]